MSFDNLRISGVSQVDVDRDVGIHLEKNTYMLFPFFYDLIIWEESKKYQCSEENLPKVDF